ncbi:MAG: hypothetical protein ACI4J7_04310 [Ruminiclostridium sp.]
MKIIKKIALLITIVLAVSSCNSNRGTNTRTETTTYDYDIPDIIKQNIDISVQGDIVTWNDTYGNPKESAATTETAEEDEGYTPYVSDATGFYDGIAILEIDMTGDNDNNFYAYNYYDKTYTLLEIEEMPMCYSGTTAVLKDYSILSLTSGKIIMSPGDDYDRLIKSETVFETKDKGSYYYYNNGRETECYFGDYLIAFKEEEKFEGNIYSLGVIDNNGNWVVPMSSELSIFNSVSFEDEQNLIETGAFGYSYDYSFNYIGNGIIEVGKYAYSFLDDAIICETSGQAQFATDKAILVDSIYGNALYIYNRLTDEWLKYNYDFHLATEKGFLISHYDSDRNKTVYLILDYDLNTIFDLSDYDSVSSGSLQFTDNNAAFTAKGASGDTYFCVIDKNGDLVFEPIKSQYGEDNYLLEDDRLIMYFNDNAIYDFDTKETSYIMASRTNATLYTASYNPETDTYLCSEAVPLEFFGSIPSYYYTKSNGEEVLNFPLQLN